MYTEAHEVVDEIFLDEAVQNILLQLPETERSIIYARWFYQYTLRQCAEIFKITPERIRQKEMRALRRLRGDNFRKEFYKLGLPWLDAEKDERDLAEAKLKAQKESEEATKKWMEENRKRLEELKLQRLSYPVQKPLEVPLVEVVTLKTPGRRSILPPKQVVLLRTPEGNPYLWVHPGWGIISRDKDPERYDEWLDWLLKNENKDSEMRRDLRNGSA